MENLTSALKTVLFQNGADLAGIGSLAELPGEQRYDLPIGVSVAVKYPKEVISGILDLPTPEYKQWYDRLNRLLDQIVTAGADFLVRQGYRAVAKSRAEVGGYGEDCLTLLPHKTVATRAGIGWVGKSSLLVTKQYGSMVRLSSILTDAPLAVGEPVNQSKCGRCSVCQDACPAGAIHGVLWRPGLERNALFDYRMCSEEAKDRAMRGFGQRTEICGKCIVVCPYTKRYLNQ